MRHCVTNFISKFPTRIFAQSCDRVFARLVFVQFRPPNRSSDLLRRRRYCGPYNISQCMYFSYRSVFFSTIFPVRPIFNVNNTIDDDRVQSHMATRLRVVYETNSPLFTVRLFIIYTVNRAVFLIPEI